MLQVSTRFDSRTNVCGCGEGQAVVRVSGGHVWVGRRFVSVWDSRSGKSSVCARGFCWVFMWWVCCGFRGFLGVCFDIGRVPGKIGF